MRCPFCFADDTQVKDSRPADDKLSIRRRRVCNECGMRFSTVERTQLKELIVIKKNGEKRPFDREKIAKSIKMAIRKRQISDEKIELIISSLVRQFELLGDAEISTSIIGESIMQELSLIDQVAYVRFASVYKEFNTAADFESFINKQLRSIS